MSDQITLIVWVDGDFKLFVFHERYLDNPLFSLKDIIYRETGTIVESFYLQPPNESDKENCKPLDEFKSFRDLTLTSGSRLFATTIHV